MGKCRSTGRARLDKYYNLAKEKGYRARSAFKLIQINRKYKFLRDAHILIDLCAAPGGWLQVAIQEMPSRRKIIGVDLEQIKFIGGVETFVADIMSEDCRIQLKGILGAHKADVVLHDGAPNVGVTWENDAFNQNLLVLYSTRLATEFLRVGGTFVTKVFRSRDYLSLLEVLGKLFKSIETSKPLSSRLQSAEIFLVCTGFIGDSATDRTALEPSVVFRKASNNDQYGKFNFNKKITFTDFMREDSQYDTPETLCKLSEIVVNLTEESTAEILDDELIDLFNDIKVLGMGDIKRILKSRASITRLVRKGEVTIPELSFLKSEEEENISEIEEFFDMTMEERLNDMQSLIEKERKRNVRRDRIAKNMPEMERDWFFSDTMFETLNIVNGEEYVEEVKNIDNKIDISSCSDSLDLNEEEVLCISKLKDDPEGFIEDTIDKYMCDPDEILPDCLREDQDAFLRKPKTNERRFTKKEKELLARKKTRQERRAELFMRNSVADDSEEGENTVGKINKNSSRKKKTEAIIVFPKKGRHPLPKGKGRKILLDRRMKKDKKRVKTRRK